MINGAFKLDPQSSWHSETPKVSCPAAKQKTKNKGCHREADPSCPAAKQKTKNKGCHREADRVLCPSISRRVAASSRTILGRAFPPCHHMINGAFKLDPQSSWHSETPKVSCPAAKQKTKNKGCHREADPVTAKPTQAVRLPSKKPKTKAVTAKPTLSPRSRPKLSGCQAKNQKQRLSPRSRPLSPRSRPSPLSFHQPARGRIIANDPRAGIPAPSQDK